MSNDRKTYLGDGVWASVDGDRIVLMKQRTRTEQDAIALDPDVMKELAKYAKAAEAAKEGKA
jgi:hypothetical protein